MGHLYREAGKPFRLRPIERLRKDWTTAMTGVPLDRHAVYNLYKRMRPIKLRRLVVP